MADNKKNPLETTHNTVTTASYPQTVKDTQQYWDNVVSQQYQQAGVRRVGGGK